MADTEQMNQHALLAGRTFPWHELYVPNVETAVAFYTEGLGFETTSFDMGEAGSYQTLTRDGKSICGVMGTNTPGFPEVPPHWAVYLSVDDVDARVAKCLELGATLVVPAMDVPSVGRMALIADPQGAHLWLFKDASG